MLFNSLGFIAFFLVLLALHNLPFSWRSKKLFLLVGSYLFYAAWNPPFVLLLWLSTAIDWYAADRIYKEQRPGRRRAFLVLSLVGNLGMLSVFKYGAFLIENFTAMMHTIGVPFQAAKPDIILPVGISFYTFQTLSYTLGVYLRRDKPASSLMDFALYVTFFPQLVAGPIVRPGQLVPQFAEPRRANRNQLVWGLFLLTLGLFQKVVLADALLSGSVEAVYDWGIQPHWFDAWMGTLAFSGQIFCDFAGYSTCAIGIGLCFGFSLPNNFRFPYAAIGFSDFWRRWHISLSSWLRDYLYIPLGGNRKGKTRTYVNIMITMFLGGLWHGASWTFVVWGVLHGLYLCVERLVRGWFTGVAWLKNAGVRVLLGFATFLLVSLTWVFFRAQEFPTAWMLLKTMTTFDALGARLLAFRELSQVIAVISLLVLSHWGLRNTNFEAALQKKPWWLIALAWVFMLGMLILVQGGGDAFIYFQF